MFIGYPIPPALRWVSSRAVADHPHSFPLWPPKGVRRTQEGFRGGEFETFAWDHKIQIECPN